MSDPIRRQLEVMPRAERDAMLAVTDGRSFNQFMELMIQGRQASFDELLDSYKGESLLQVGKLLGERTSYRYMRDRILAFKADIKAVNKAEDKRAEEAETKTGKE